MPQPQEILHPQACPAPPFVVLDACVLMSTVQRQLLLRVAEQGVFQPIWTERIGEEWRRNAERVWQVPPEKLANQWADMNQRFPGAMEPNTDPYEVGLRYSDPKDFHVIAAGLARRARGGLQRPPAVHVMTWNLKDFNRSELRRQGLRVCTPRSIAGRLVAGRIIAPGRCRTGCGCRLCYAGPRARAAGRHLTA